MLYSRIFSTVLALLLLVCSQTNVVAQDNKTKKEVWEVCGGFEALRRHVRLTFSKAPDRLDLYEEYFSDVISSHSESVLLDDILRVERYNVSVIGKLGNKTRCEYTSRFQSCYQDGYKRINDAVPFFEDNNTDDLLIRNNVIWAIAESLSDLSYQYIVDRSDPKIPIFTGVDAEDSIFINFNEIDLGKALLLQDTINGFYCSASVMTDDQILTGQNEIAQNILVLSGSRSQEQRVSAPVFETNPELVSGGSGDAGVSYDIRIVNIEDMMTGFIRIPPNNSGEPRYYIVVEAVDADGTVISLPVRNEESGKAELVSVWGLRVPEATYRAVAEDKADDGILQRSIVGLKESGAGEIKYLMPVLGGAVTEWCDSGSNCTSEESNGRSEKDNIEKQVDIRGCINMPPGAEEARSVAVVEFKIDSEGQVTEQPIVVSTTDDVYARAVARAIMRCGPYRDLRGETVRANFAAREY